jgi:hypothetical protein
MPSTEKVEHFLTSIYRHFDEQQTSIVKTIAIVVTHPVLTFAALQYILHLPTVDVTIPESDKSKAPWLYDPRKPWKLRGFASSYIELPSPLHHFWQGQAKQNVRKATARAKNAGFVARAVDSVEIVEVVAQVFRDKGWDAHEIETMERYLRGPLEGGIFVAVYDEKEYAVAFCTGVQAGNAVRTFWANTSEKGQVRWLCFSGFVEEASARGARYIVESPLWAIPEGNRVFARRLGFRPARIRSA